MYGHPYPKNIRVWKSVKNANVKSNYVYTVYSYALHQDYYGLSMNELYSALKSRNPHWFT